MAMRALLRGASARFFRSRSVAAADSRSKFPRDGESDGAASAVVASYPVLQIPLPKSTRFFPSWTGPSSHSVSGLLHSLCLSSSAPAFVAVRIPSPVSSLLVAGSSAAPLSSSFAGLHRSLADVRLGNVAAVGAPKPGFASLALWTSMQQRRSLSKLKKYKMKSYSSYKERFKLMADGTYKRWRSGTRHNAHSKTAKQRRQLRRPSIAPAALATVMKKLNFVR